MSSKVSFTIRRPTPDSRSTSSGPESDNLTFKLPSIPRHLTTSSSTSSPLSRSATSSPRPSKQLLSYAQDDSDGGDDDNENYNDDAYHDDDDDVQDELVTGFDQFGVQRLHEKPKKPQQGPLVIPALQNRDWRETARKRKQVSGFRPSAAAGVPVGADGSVGGLGTRDVLNNTKLQAGLRITKRVKLEMDMDVVVENGGAVGALSNPKTEDVQPETETEDQKAIRAILASAESGTNDPDEPIIDIIPPITEADAYQQDVQELPDTATLEDYARVPVAQFGAALLRGMGWKEGTAASRTRTGPAAPYIPAMRPALLGLGAKEWEAPDDGSQKKKKGGLSDRKYMPVVKRERELARGDDRSRSGTPGGSGSNSRRRTPSPRRSSAPGSRHQSAPSSRKTSRSPSRRERNSDRDESERALDRRHKDRSQAYDDSSNKHSSRRWDDDGYRRRDRDGDKDRKRRDSPRPLQIA